MTTGLVVVLAIVVVAVIIFASKGGGTFDDPKPMSNQHLLSAIAGQADCLEKIRRAPFESQLSPSIVEIARKRKVYIAQLCTEVISRASSIEGLLKYPGATVALNVFSETAEYAKELEATGVSPEKAAVRAVKEKLFAANGAVYPSSWEA